MEKTIHQGRNVKRFREMLGIKQEALASYLGDDWNQKKVSMLEQKEVIEGRLLKQISNALNLPVAAIESFDEQQAINIITNTVNNHDNATSMVNNNVEVLHNNPIDQLVKLHEDKIALYERMLQEKEEMMLRLEKLLKKED